MLHENCGNPFVQIYKHAYEILRSEYERQVKKGGSEEFHIRLSPQMKMELVVGADRRTENLPTVDEVAGIIPNEYSKEGFRDIIITYKESSSENHENLALFKRINENHAAYMPLHYVLLFPRGELGWHWGLRLEGSSPNNPNEQEEVENDEEDDGKRLTQRAFYRYRLHVRENEAKTLFLAKRLFQQYLIDSWAVCEQSKLNWIRSNQDALRADVYQGLADAVTSADHNLEEIGQLSVLPSSFTGGPRFMAHLYQNAMAICRYLGKPTLFITFTANPKWKEIKDELLHGQTASDRPDLVARVFNLKLKELLDQLKRKNIFGTYKGLVRTIEYQKRGLPMLIFYFSWTMTVTGLTLVKGLIKSFALKYRIRRKIPNCMISLSKT